MHKVVGSRVDLHTTKAGKRLVKVTLLLEQSAPVHEACDWICLPPDYDGYAVDAGLRKLGEYCLWTEINPHDLAWTLWEILDRFRAPELVELSGRDIKRKVF